MAQVRTVQIAGGCNGTFGAADLAYPLLYYCSGTEVLVHNLETHTTTFSLAAHKDKVNCVKHANEYVFSGGCDKKLYVWKNHQQHQEIILSGPLIEIGVGKEVCVITSDGIVRMYSLGERLELETELCFSSNLQECSAQITYCSTSFLALGGADAKIHLFAKLEGEWVFLNSLEGHSRTVRTLEFQELNQELFLASGGQEGQIRIWKFYKEIPESSLDSQGLYPLDQVNMSCKLEAVLMEHSSCVSCLKWMGNNIVSSSHDCSVLVWAEDSRSGTWVPKASMGQIGNSKYMFFGVVCSDNVIMAYSYSGGFYRWNFEEEEWKSQIAPTGHFGGITGLVANSQFVVTSSLDQTTRLWSEARGVWREVSRPMIHGYDLNTIALFKNTLVSGGDEKVLRLFDFSKVSADVLRNECGVELEGVTAGAGQALGLMTKATDQDIDISNYKITEDVLTNHTLWPEVCKLYGHGYEVVTLATGHTYPVLASASKAQSAEYAKVFLWNLEQKSQLQTLEFHNLTVTDLAFSHDDKFLLSVSRDRNWCLYEFLDGEYRVSKSSQAHARMIYCCAWSPEDKIFLTGSRDKRLKLWNKQGECLDTLMFSAGVTACAWITPQIIAVGLENGVVSVREIHAKSELTRYSHGKCVNKLAWNGEYLFSASADHTLRIEHIEPNNF